MNLLMETLPTLKQRIGGKSIPIEKFVIKKAEKFKSQVNVSDSLAAS